MDVLLFNVEIASLAGIMVGVHALRGRLGLAPLYLVSGLMLAFMTVGSRLKVVVPTPFGTSGYGSLYLSVLLTAVVLLYVLEGTREARKAIGTIVVGSLVLAGLKLLLASHLVDTDLAMYGRERWSHPSLFGALASAIALTADGIVILLVYQALHNLPRMPLIVALTGAQTAGMFADGIVFGGLYGSLGINMPELGAKTLAGFAASIPTALYIWIRLRNAEDEIRHGVLHRRVFDLVSLRDQLADAQEALARKQAEYEHIRDVFGRYVVPDVVDEILQDTQQLELGGKNADVTVIFTDIRGYSSLSEQMTPQQIIALLNEYFGAMSKIIGEYRGTIIEFEGDAILAVFGAPLPQDDHEVRAVQCCLDMLERVEELNAVWETNDTARHWKEIGIPDFRIRVGIHSGPVVVGNIGSEHRTKYAVIGDTVNTTARVESLNKELRTTILLTESTAEGLGTMRAGLQKMGTHTVRGRKEPVVVYTFLDAENIDATRT